jgi:ABC-2 type transport system ATP-binding protein
MIHLDQVGKRFGNFVALNGIMLAMEPERTYGLWGCNGAGKTTLIQIMIGALAPDHGTVRVMGKDPMEDWTLRRRMGIVDDGDTYFPELTAREFLWWVSRLRDLPDDQSDLEIEELASALCLQKALDKLVGTLSHGMRRKLLLAGAFVGESPLMLLDEPTNGLDVDSLFALSGLLQDHRKKGGTAVLASHDSSFLKSACSDVIVLKDGTVIEHGPIQNVELTSNYDRP